MSVSPIISAIVTPIVSAIVSGDMPLTGVMPVTGDYYFDDAETLLHYFDDGLTLNHAVDD